MKKYEHNNESRLNSKRTHFKVEFANLQNYNEKVVKLFQNMKNL